MKRLQITNGFEEVEVEKGQVLELEGQKPKYLWLILQGEIDIFKRIESVYSEQGRATDTRNVSLFVNPKTAGDIKIGSKVSSLQPYNLLCEDAIFFN